MDIFGGGLVGRPAQKIGKPFDVADILVVRPGAEPAKRHVLDQPPASRTDGLVGHWGLLSWVRSSTPRSQDRTPASATPRNPSLVTNYRGSGLVLRHDLAVRHRIGEGQHSTQLNRSRRVLRMAGMGHKDSFLRPRLNTRYRFSKGTLAGTRGNGRDAPIPDLPGLLLAAHPNRSHHQLDTQRRRISSRSVELSRAPHRVAIASTYRQRYHFSNR